MDVLEDPPCYLVQDDLYKSCYYARDYVSRGGYAASEANQLVSNLKKSVSKRGTNEWRYKEAAISKFSGELSAWLADSDNEFTIAAIPCSKHRSDAEYDDRLDRVIEQVAKRCQNATAVRPFSRKVSRQAAHLSNTRPSISEIYDSLMWDGFELHTELVLLVDDVITTGASFRACYRLFMENAPTAQVYGVFWARTVWPDQPDVNLAEFDF